MNTGGGDIIFQIGTAKYGVRDEDGNLSDDRLREIAAHDQVKMFELKMSQGAKPGKGGILPGIKVNAEIAAIRGIPEGEDSISPNRHPEINDAGSMLDMINHIRDVTGKPVGFKAVVGSYSWLTDLAKEIQRRGIASAPDFITVDSGDGGTGAAPMALMDNVGLVIKEAPPLVVDILTEHGLRDRIKVIASGKLVTPSEVAWALAVGADFINSARGFMFSLGCIQSLKCNRNTCPTGITTTSKRLQKGLNPEDHTPMTDPKAQIIKASDLFVKALEAEGVEQIFAVPGEENLDLVESLRTSSIKLILTRHEQGAGFMAATYGRLTGKPGVCMATLGPGATNLTTPAAYAHLGGFPLIMITGQKPIKTSKQGQFQIIDIVNLFDPICKMSKQIVHGNTIPSLVREAFRLASEERPGAVLLELPEDIAEEPCDAPVIKPHARHYAEAGDAAIADAYRKLSDGE